MKGHPTRVTVRSARYSSFDPDRWWETRAGVRTKSSSFRSSCSTSSCTQCHFDIEPFEVLLGGCDKSRSSDRNGSLAPNNIWRRGSCAERLIEAAAGRRSMIAISKVCCRSFGTFGVTSPACVCSLRL